MAEPVVLSSYPEPTTGGPKPKKRPKTGVVKGGLEQQPLPTIGYIRFRAVNNEKLGLVVELNGDVLPAGYGEFAVTDRPGRVGITGYSGRKPLTLKIPLLFDGWRTRSSMEDELRMLERLHGLDAALAQPPVIIVEGFGIPHSYSRAPQNRFAFTGDPQWDDSDIRTRKPDGHRLYIACTVTAQMIVRPQSLAAATTTSAAGESRHYYTVPKHGKPRDLKGIAKKYGKTWRQIRALNPKLPGDPDHDLKAGTKVRYS